MKRIKTAGYPECLEWADKTALLCTSYLPGKLADGAGMELCINIDLGVAGRGTVCLKLKNQREVDDFCAFIQEKAKEMIP